MKKVSFIILIVAGSLVCIIGLLGFFGSGKAEPEPEPEPEVKPDKETKEPNAG